MPKATEVCEVAAGGKRYRNWTTVRLRRDVGTWASDFMLTVAEPSKKGSGWEGLKLKPGDPVQITLAGFKFLTGVVETRQVVLTAQAHAVQIVGLSVTEAPVKGSMVTSQLDFKGYGFPAIARSVLAPYGIKFKLNNAPAGIEKPFKIEHGFPGETVFQFLERLARQRGIFITDNADGDLVGAEVDTSASSAATLEEGRNIYEASAIITDASFRSEYVGFSQIPGSDDAWGKAASQLSAKAESTVFKRHRPLVFAADRPSTKEDLAQRIDREQAQRIGTSVQISIVVKGWLKPGGKELWKEGEMISVRSPSIFPMKDPTMKLAVQAVTFAQDSVRGSTTTLDLVLPEALQLAFPKGPGGSPNLFDQKPQQAKPEGN